MKKIGSLVTLAAVSAALAVAGPAPAQDNNGVPCASPPPTPKGHVLAKVEKVESNGGVTLRVLHEPNGRLKPKPGDAAYLLKCNGYRLGGAGDVKVQTVSGATATVAIAAPKAEVEGHYVAIDTGYDSQPPLREGEVRPPAGYASARIIGVDIVHDKTRILIGRGYGQGVFPGAKGYVVDEKGTPVRGGAFTVEEATSDRAVRAFVSTTIDGLGKNPGVFVEESPRRCTAPDPVMPAGAELARVLQGGAPPQGWSAIDLPTSRAQFPQFTVNAGTNQGVLPPVKAFFIVGRGTGALHPATPSSIKASTSVFTVGGDNASVLKDAPLRLIVSTGKCT
jgi:hypothetical protein